MHTYDPISLEVLIMAVSILNRSAFRRQDVYIRFESQR